jgi:hypothetical protein
MLTRAPTPREILTEWARNRHGARRTPAVSVQCFHLEFNEDMPDACHFPVLPDVSAPGSSAAGAVGASPVPAATNMENE